MNIIKPINYYDMLDSIEIHHVGWSSDELAGFTKQYQSRFYGSVDDARFEITDSKGNVYYAVFKNPADNKGIDNKSNDYLVFKDQNRALLNVGGLLYRYLINERQVLDNACYAGIIYNDFDKQNSPYFHSIASPQHELMIISDCEGVAAINWDKVLWKNPFEWSNSGNLELLSVDDQHVKAKYDDCIEGYFSISFNLQDGKYTMEPL